MNFEDLAIYEPKADGSVSVYLREPIHCFIQNERGGFNSKPTYVIPKGTKGVISGVYVEGESWEPQEEYFVILLDFEYEGELKSDRVEKARIWEKYSSAPIPPQDGI